jgi:propionyl-CoA carboxylase alpha chain
MGDKIESKKLAIEAKVNTIPGYNDAIAGPDEAVEIAQGIGYPVMIKASAGGGGKGLRVAFNDAEAHEGFSSCVNEARNSFGDDRVFIEKYVLEPRHIEIQVLGDSHGNYVYLNERECSIQRRHQKVIEEAPSPFVDPRCARRWASRPWPWPVRLITNPPVPSNSSFRRHQGVLLPGNEHPPAGRTSGHRTDHRPRPGRADDPRRLRRKAAASPRPMSSSTAGRWNAGSTPKTRSAASCPPPVVWSSSSRPRKPPTPRVRVDTGVYDGGEISMFYDSMIAKLIVHGATREQAIARMRDALNAFVIRGISSNIPFQAALMQHPRFHSGNFNTGFIAEEYPKGFDASMVPHDDPALLVSVAAYVYRAFTDRSASVSGQLQGHERIVSDKWWWCA